MNKRLICVFLFLALVSAAVFADVEYEVGTKSYINVPVVKVYDHTKAYVVIYMKEGVSYGSTSIPKDWFKQGSSTRKAQVKALPKGLDPYLTICFEDGEFSFVYINMPASRMDSAWGVMNGGKLPDEFDPLLVASRK